MDGRRLHRPACVALALAALAACDGGEVEGWTVEQAENAVTSVRGLPVRQPRCRGLGRAEAEPPRYLQFACSAGARAPGERFETVAVLYELHVRDSGYVLRAIRFVGGPGIP
ncbi:MAG TPA: hypothetical protein VFL61_11945 [Gaiellaceae bacterium]|nr:hypothetical protein [Gaiellaceae bacterium]